MATITKKRFKKIATMRESTEKEQNFKKSETVPDQSLSVREIMVRFANGTLGDITRELEFTEDLPDLRNLDISQVHAMREQGRQDIAAMQESVKKAKANKQQNPPAEDAEIITE